MNITATDYHEVQVNLSGDYLRYHPAQGPSYSSGGEPAEGGYCEDINITDIILFRKDKKKSLFEDVDKDNPEVQKIIANLIRLFEDDYQEVLFQSIPDQED